MKSTVSVRCIPGSTTNAMKHYLKGCLEDSSPDNIILHHGTNNLKSDDNSEKIASDIVDLGLSVKNEKTMVYISSLVISYDKLDKKRKEVKGATKSYFTHYMLVVIILFNTGLYESAISTYSFAKLLFLCFIWFSVYSVF